MAQDVGAHRRKVYSTAPTVEEELWRRAFWVLVAMDRATSFALGRPCAIQDEEYVSFLSWCLTGLAACLWTRPGLPYDR